MNVLLSCAGRRGYLVRYFREALAGGGLVVAADATAEAPALAEADVALQLPRVDDPDYVPALLDACQAHDVQLVVPLNDLELPVLSRARARFAEIGTTVVVSRPQVIDMCFDKWRTHAQLRRAGLPTLGCWVTPADALRALGAGELAFPVTVKPRWGSGSLGVEQVHDTVELAAAHALLAARLRRGPLAAASAGDWPRSILFQETATGQEYGLDVVNDLAGRHAATFARRKVAMRAGETDRAVTVDDPRLRRLGERLGHLAQHVGVLDCDVFVAGSRITVLEMNPRFGGGYPFSHTAGADVPAALLAWSRGLAAPAGWSDQRAGVAGAKQDTVVTSRLRAAAPGVSA